MKAANRPFISLFVFLVLSMSACDSVDLKGEPENQDVIKHRQKEITDETDAALLTMLQEMGYERALIENKGGWFLVERDIRIHKQMLIEQLAERSAIKGDRNHHVQQRCSGTLSQDCLDITLVSQNVVGNITVNTAGLTSHTNWKLAAQQAMSTWNNVSGSKVKFVENNSIQNPHITFIHWANAGGEGDWPSGGLPGTTIHVGDRNPGNTGIGELQWRKMIAAHELGHNIGLAHSDNANFPVIAGTPDYESSSIMITDIILQNSRDLSANDKLAVQLLYPSSSVSSPPAKPSLSSSFSGNHHIQLNWNSVSGAVSYIVKRYSGGIQGTLNDGDNPLGNVTTKKDYPYAEPNFSTFIPYSFGFACYTVRAVNSAGEGAESNSVCYGVNGSGGF